MDLKEIKKVVQNSYERRYGDKQMGMVDYSTIIEFKEKSLKLTPDRYIISNNKISNKPLTALEKAIDMKFLENIQRAVDEFKKNEREARKNAYKLRRNRPNRLQLS